MSESLDQARAAFDALTAEERWEYLHDLEGVQVAEAKRRLDKDMDWHPGGAYGIAVHEAGHAVAQYRLGYELHNVEFTPNGFRGLVGAMRADDPDDDAFGRLDDRYNTTTPTRKDGLIICLAGAVAQAMHSGWKLDEVLRRTGAGDFADIKEMLHLDELSRWPEAAAAMVTLERNTYELVRHHWSDIVRVADVLQQRGELSFDEVVAYLDVPTKW
jgi:hypothetical protein